MIKYKISALCAAVLIAAGLSGCAHAAEQTQATEAAATAPIIESLCLVVTEENIGQLENYPDLKTLDLSGSTCMEAIRHYMVAHPDVFVTYTVPIGGKAVAWDSEELVLYPGEYDYDTLLGNLSYLPRLSELVLPETELTAEQIAALSETAGEIPVSYSVEILGTVYSGESTFVDLAGMQPEDLERVSGQLEMLPFVTEANLMDGDNNCALSLDDVTALQKVLPNASFSYTFDLFGQRISTADKEVVFRNKKIGNEGEPQIRQALDLMYGCEYLLLENCRLDNEVLATLRDDYRDRTKIVWRVWFGRGGSCLTDREVIRFVYGLDNSNCHDLIYCEDVRFIDFGHNETLSDVSYVASMKKLEAIIVSGAPIHDLSAFANCESLEFLEIAFCHYVEDISPLEDCKNLRMLNISYTQVSDLSPVAELPLEKLCSMHSRVSEEDQQIYMDAHPDCIAQFKGTQPYGYAWRYEEDGVTRNAYYAMLREVFNYDHATNTTW